ncbi:MAG: phage portal protein [Alphaproteobacteria bacterium]|nr:MAG: phage portal protein [Alphaproteobacteria bacterium]
MTGDEIFKIITNWTSSDLYKRMADGLRYYKCGNDVLKRKFYYYKYGEKVIDTYRANVKIVDDFLKIIIDQKVSYCLAKDVIIDNVKDLPFDINDEIDYVAEDASQKSRSWCFVWIDEAGLFRQKQINSEIVIPLYDGSIEEKMTGLIRTYSLNDEDFAEYWEDNYKTLYKKDGSKYIEVSKVTHLDNNVGWGKIPFIRLLNNRYEMTDLDNIKSLIDAYDYTISDFANNFIDFQEVIYKLVNYAESLKDEQSLSELVDFLKKYKIVSVDENGDFDVLVNEVPSEARSLFLEILRKNIYQMSHSVDTEKLSGGDLTNVTIKAYFTNLDQKCNKFLKECKRYVMDMLYFSNKYKEFKSLPLDDLTKVNIKFNKSQIINETEIVELLVSMGMRLSRETMLKLTPWVDDPEEEMKKLDKEADTEAQSMDPDPTKQANFNKIL